MDIRQYNGIINWTVSHETSDDLLNNVRLIFKNMGIALPQGDLKHIIDTLRTNDYMGWKSCSVSEARDYAENGIATIGLNEQTIKVFAVNDDDAPIIENNYVATLSDETSVFAVDGLEYYSYIFGTSTCCCQSNCCHKNELFNMDNQENLKSDFSSLLGEKQDILSHYTTTECINIILKYDDKITEYCNSYCIPKQFVQTLLLRELWCVDVSDDAADAAVKEYFVWKQSCEDWENLSIAEKAIIPFPTAPLVIREDSSTGIGQMFARVAINANNLAVDMGLIGDKKYDPEDWHDRKLLWYALHNSDTFAIRMTTLEIHHCASYNGINCNLFHCTEDQIKAILSRYNGTNDAAKEYGNQCYEYYKIFMKY